MTGPRPATGRTNVKLDPDVLDRLRRWAYWERLKLQHVLEAAAIEALTAPPKPPTAAPGHRSPAA